MVIYPMFEIVLTKLVDYKALSIQRQALAELTSRTVVRVANTNTTNK